MDPGSSAALNPAGESALKAAVAVIRGLSKGVRVEIQGHANSAGTPEVDRAVSLARAQQVKQRPQTLGLGSPRVDAVGIGDARPLDPADTPEAQERNRRIELHLYSE